MKRLIGTSAFLGIVLTSVSALGVTYTITDLGAVGGANGSGGLAINSQGDVAGIASLPGNLTHGVMYSNGAIDLGTLGGNSSRAEGINGSGEVVGWANAGDGSTRAFLYANGQMNDINSLLAPGGDWNLQVATAINDAGQITGEAIRAGSQVHGFIYSNGTVTDIGNLGADPATDLTDGIAINASGHITGGSIRPTNGGGVTHAFLYSNGVMQDIDTNTSRTSLGTAINSRDEIAGSMGVGNYQHAFLYSNGVMEDLGTFGGNNSYAYGVNDLGEVVGVASYPGTGPQHAFICTGNGLTDLNSVLVAGTGWELTWATAINDSGQITGQGIAPSGALHAYVLTPTAEPGSIGVLGMVALLLLRRRIGRCGDDGR